MTVATCTGCGTSEQRPAPDSTPEGWWDTQRYGRLAFEGWEFCSTECAMKWFVAEAESEERTVS